MRYSEKLGFAADLFNGLYKSPEVIVFGENMIPMFHIPPEVMEKSSWAKYNLTSMLFKIMPCKVSEMFSNTWRAVFSKKVQIGDCIFYIADGWTNAIIRDMIRRRFRDVYMYSLTKDLKCTYGEILRETQNHNFHVAKITLLLFGVKNIDVKKQIGVTYRLDGWNLSNLVWLLSNRYIDIKEVPDFIIRKMENIFLEELDFGKEEINDILGFNRDMSVIQYDGMTIGNVIAVKDNLTNGVNNSLKNAVNAVQTY